MSVGSAFATDTVDVELAAALNTDLDGSVSAKKNLFHVTEREENRPLELRTHARAAIAEAIFARTESQLFAPSIEFDDAQIETSELSTESDDDRENLI